MESKIVAAGSINVTIEADLRLAATWPAPATGLDVTTLTASYVRERAARVATALALLGAVDAAHADNSAIEIEATDAPGLYRVDWPDAAFAAGVSHVTLCIKGATITPWRARVELKVGEQVRRTHALAGGTIVRKEWDPDVTPNPTWEHMDEAGANVLITRTRTVAGTVETETPS